MMYVISQMVINTKEPEKSDIINIVIYDTDSYDDDYEEALEAYEQAKAELYDSWVSPGKKKWKEVDASLGLGFEGLQSVIKYYELILIAKLEFYPKDFKF